MEVMRVLNAIVLLSIIVPIGFFLLNFKEMKGYRDVATILRWQSTSVLLLAFGPFVINIFNLYDPLTINEYEQAWSLTTRLFAAAGAWFWLSIWLRHRRTPIIHNRRRDDPKTEGIEI